MTQPFTSGDHLVNIDLLAEGQLSEVSAEHLAALSSSDQPAIVHPNFDPAQVPLDPARPLNDIPEPARRLNEQLRRLYGHATHCHCPNQGSLSKWGLIASEALAEHLSLLSAARLIALPESFYHNHSEQPLLSSLNKMTLLDMSDIQQAIRTYPKLNRYGFSAIEDKRDDKHHNTEKASTELSLRALTKRYNPDELLSSIYADDWQVILQPQAFETGAGSLATDIMACSVAVHALKQCQTRKSINHSYSATQICQHIRGYLLSQIVAAPNQRHAYRQIRIFAGHVIVAAHYLGWSIQQSHEGECHFNISSRCGLLTRYPNMQDYDINGWSS